MSARESAAVSAARPAYLKSDDFIPICLATAALLSVDPAIIRFLDPTFYRLFRIWFFAIQPFVACVGLVGSTLVVGRMLSQESQATPKSR